MNIILEDDYYKLLIDDIGKYDFLEKDCKYAIYDDYLYVLPKTYSLLLKQIIKEKKDAKIMIVCPTSLVYN